MTYAELKAQFNALLNRTDLTTALQTLFLDQAVTRSQRELRVPGNEKEVETTVGAVFTGLTVPSDYIQTISMECEDEPVEYLPVGTFRKLGVPTSGQPHYYTRVLGVISFNPNPSADMVIAHSYYGEFPSFGAESASTVLSVSLSDLVLYGALSFAADYYLDERAISFEQRFQSILVAVQAQGYDADGFNSAVQPAYSLDND